MCALAGASVQRDANYRSLTCRQTLLSVQGQALASTAQRGPGGRARPSRTGHARGGRPVRAGAYELEEENVRLTVTRCHRGWASSCIGRRLRADADGVTFRRRVHSSQW